MSDLLFRIPNVPDVGTRAAFKSVQSSDPAANTECSVTVPTGKFYKIVSASLPLVQGVTQTPLPALVIKDSAGVVMGQFNGASAAQSVSTTSQYNWFPKAVLTAGAALATNQAPIPDDLLVAGGWTISTSTAGKGAATDLGALSLWVIELRP